MSQTSERSTLEYVFPQQGRRECLGQNHRGLDHVCVDLIPHPAVGVWRACAGVILSMDEFLHHLRNPGMRIPRPRMPQSLYPGTQQGKAHMSVLGPRSLLLVSSVESGIKLFATGSPCPVSEYIGAFTSGRMNLVPPFYAAVAFLPLCFPFVLRQTICMFPVGVRFWSVGWSVAFLLGWLVGWWVVHLGCFVRSLTFPFPCVCPWFKLSSPLKGIKQHLGLT